MAQLIARGHLAAHAAAQGLLCGEEGQDTIEYGMVAVLVSIAAISVIVLFGPELRNWYQDIVNAIP